MKHLYQSTLPSSCATVALALALFAVPASAGEGKAADKAAYAQCTCEGCAMYKADVATLCNNLIAGTAPASLCEGTCAAEFAATQKNPSHFYAGIFMARQGEIDQALAAVEKSFASSCATDEQRARLIDFASHFPKRANAGLTAAMWKSSPQLFSTDHLIAFAWDGPKEIVGELKARASKDVKVAAYFAYSGDTSNKALLEGAVKCGDVSSGSIREAAVAALGLNALGDTKTISKLLSRAREGSLALLDQGKLPQARSLALEAHYFAKLLDKGYASQIAWIDTELDQMNRTKAEKLASAEEVFKLIESIQS